ncbi:MAG TPA: Flp family type IVb pilin [Sphingobium sp.]|uniref:Flp family type IVb pilin n=1 Tax=Sphingobium sp. TaxID=1912891 RepID=UPI002ED38CDA
MYRLFSSLRRDEKGATAVEYGLILAMVFLAIIAAVNNVADKTNGMWNKVSNAVNNH